MAETQMWSLIQSWMDGQLVRVNQSALAEAVGVTRQALSQWKNGQARPSPETLRRLRDVTRLEWSVLTDALLHDMGYTEEDEHGTATNQAGGSPATPTAPDLRLAARKTGRQGSAGRARSAQDEQGETP